MLVADAASKALSSHGVGSAADGRCVVVWRGDPDGGVLNGLPMPGFARLFDAKGVPLAPPFKVTTTPAGIRDVADPQVGVSATGDFVVVWLTSTDTTPSQGTLLGRRFDAIGTPVGGTFTVAPPSTAGEIDSHELAMSADGQFALVYARYGNVQGTNIWSSSGVYGRRYDAAAVPLGGEFRASAAGFHERSVARVALTPASDMGIAWRKSEIGETQMFLHVRVYTARLCAVHSDGRRQRRGGRITWRSRQ